MHVPYPGVFTLPKCHKRRRPTRGFSPLKIFPPFFMGETEIRYSLGQTMTNEKARLRTQ